MAFVQINNDPVEVEEGTFLGQVAQFKKELNAALQRVPNPVVLVTKSGQTFQLDKDGQGNYPYQVEHGDQITIQEKRPRFGGNRVCDLS